MVLNRWNRGVEGQEERQPVDTIDDDWVEHHFDHLSPQLSREFHPTLARARARCPVTRSDQHDGFWLVTGYEEVLGVAQDWQTFSSAQGITVPGPPPGAPQMKVLPVGIDPPLQRVFKRLINVHFTPAKVAPWEAPTRALVSRLIDAFVERGSCDFMAEFARPLPGLAFFELALHAPADDLAEVNGWATRASLPDGRDDVLKLAGWIAALLERRRADGPRGDVVDAVLAAEIEGRPITPQEAIGTVQLLVLGGLETTAGVLGAAMLRFCADPAILTRLRERPELIPSAVEELLRMDGSFVCIARTATHDTELGGRLVEEGERVLMYWASANRDGTEFPDPDVFDLHRPQNRHVAFGAGPHRCVGSNLARMNLRVALEEIVRRVEAPALVAGAEVGFHTTFNRAPLTVPITFTPGARVLDE
jgi:cytochrome P450